jgi:hypothetical protein
VCAFFLAEILDRDSLDVVVVGHVVAPGWSLAGIRVIVPRFCNATLLENFSRFFEHVSRNRFVVPVFFFIGCVFQEF